MAEPEAAHRRESLDDGLIEAETAEDTVPYLPPLASYAIQVKITDVRQGVPNIYPDEILDEDG